MSHASQQRIVNAARSVTQMQQEDDDFKVFRFYTIDFSYINAFFGFWVSQSLKLSRNICFYGFKCFLVVKFHVTKPERSTLSKM